MKSRLLPARLVVPISVITAFALAVHAWLALIKSPEDVNQGNAVRLLYIHVPAAWLAYVSFGVTTVCSILYLIPKTRNPVYDLIAGASAKAGVIFCGLTLLLGALWGKPTWGVYWAWDARVTATAVLFFLYIGYLAIRSLSDSETSRIRNAWFALFAFIDVPIVHFSVNWWRTLHQDATVLNPELKAEISGSMAFTLWFGVVAFSFLYIVMLDRQFRHDLFNLNKRTNALDDAIQQRIDEDNLVSEVS